MQKIILNGLWKMKTASDSEWISAEVPGSVYADLINAGKMEDPFWRDNEMKALSLMDNDFDYERSFVVSKEFLEHETILLHCDGIDTVADMFINGEKIAFVKNMHRTWEFDVKDILHEGENSIQVHFYSPTKHIKEEYSKAPAGGSSDAMEGYPLLRKAHCMFGWDWGPRLPDAGIWRSMELIAMNSARIESVYITQNHQPGEVELILDVDVDAFDEKSELGFSVTVTAPDGTVIINKQEKDTVTVKTPQLWWPNGYGKQPLYTVCVDLMADGIKIDSWEKKIGLRTMTMHQEKDEWGESFAHEVNGVCIFAMGADYIPEDNIFPRINKERTRVLLEDCVKANFNAIRVWGGGYYPDDFFYDLCDELGLIVWQDFMFACAVYNLTDDFEESISAEITDNVKRLRHHASLGLWCGNNEMEMFVDGWNYDCTHKQKADYIKMYEYIIPQILKKTDPNTFYWPASPSSGGGFDEPNSPDRGDVHYWDVWHGNKPFSEYRKFFFRYASEFGFQSFPSLKTVKTFTEPSDRNVFSYIMEKHQRNNAANGKIMNYMAQTFLYPTDFDTLLYASQLLQAEAIKYGVEHWRRNRGRCMGAIYWQLNDCWPVASWASIDYFGRWKALHYYAKRFFAPVMLSCKEEGIMTQDTNVNAEPYTVEKSGTLCVANETRKEFTGMVKWALRNEKSNIIREGTKKVTVAPLSSLWLEKEDFAEAELFENYMSFVLYDEANQLVSEGTVIFCPPKHFRFANPHLSVSLKGDTLTIKAQAYARCMEIDFENTDVLLSDNYFDMSAGEKQIQVLRGTPDMTAVKIRSVFNIH